MARASLWLVTCLLVGMGICVGAACSGRDAPPPEVPGVDLERLTQEEINLYRISLTKELSPCGGRVTLDQALRRTGGCPLAPLAARFVAYRVEQNDNPEEIAERYLSRFGSKQRPDIPVEGAPILGEPDAPVTLVVFSDFQCPHCAAAATRLQSMVEESEGRVRLIFLAFPLIRRAGSLESAVAAQAAHRQGRFWQMHDALYENRNRLSEDVIIGLAEEIGLDEEQFRDDLLDPALQAKVRAERDLGVELGVRGTPTLFVNGRQHLDTFARLQVAIEEELVRAEMNRSATKTSESEVRDGGASPPDGGDGES